MFRRELWYKPSVPNTGTAVIHEHELDPLESLTTFHRPPLKWAGGKRWQLPYLTAFWQSEKRRRLVEPFCGGLAVTLGLLPSRALLNDINPNLINFYSWLKKGLIIELE